VFTQYILYIGVLNAVHFIHSKKFWFISTQIWTNLNVGLKM